jgi:hypothetical protein
MSVSLKDYGPVFGRLGPTASFDSIRSWRGTLRGWRRNLSRLLKNALVSRRLLSQNGLKFAETAHSPCAMRQASGEIYDGPVVDPPKPFETSFKTVVMMAASAASKLCKAGLRCNLTKQCRSPSNGALVDLRERKVFPALHFRHLGKVAADRDSGVDTHRR